MSSRLRWVILISWRVLDVEGHTSLPVRINAYEIVIAHDGVVALFWDLVPP